MFQSLSRLFAFHRDPLAFFQTMEHHNGHRARFRMGLWNFWLLNDPASIRFVLTHHRQYFIKGPGIGPSNPLIGQGLLTQDNEVWAEQRRRFAPIFKPGNVQDMTPRIEDVISHFVANVPQGQPFDLQQAMLELSLSIVLATVFGQPQVNSSVVQSMGQEVQWLMAHFYHRSRSVFRFPYQVPGFNRRFHQHKRQLLDILRLITPQEPTTFMNVWPTISTDSEKALHELITLVVAGYETTGHALAWALNLLGQHPNVARCVYEESLKSDVPSPVTHPWTDRVIKETLRLYPSAWLLSRSSLKAVDFEDIAFRSDDIVLISPWLLHHSETWFDEADQFRPERWLTDPKPYTYIPFGAGQRGCIGEPLALLESRMALAHIIRAYRFIPQGPRRLFPGLTLQSLDPMWVSAYPR